VKTVDVMRQQYKALQDKAGSGKILTQTELRTMARLEADLADLADEELVFRRAEEVAEYSGYAVRTVRLATRKGELQRQPDKTWLQADVDAWLDAKGRRPAGSKAACPEQMPLPGSGDKQEWDRAEEEIRYRHFRATREKLLVERLQGELIPREDVYREFTRRAHEYKTSLMLLSRQISHKIAAESGVESARIAAIIDDAVVGLLREITRPIEIEVNEAARI
jgi:SpoVK/Ycf46/Vps4 family AAA+-type ATPase